MRATRKRSGCRPSHPNAAGLARRFATDERGTTAIEYAMLTLIAIAIVVSVGQVGGAIKPMYESVHGIFGN